MAATINLDTVELVSTERVAPQFGSISSSDYNASNLEILTDLASLADKINSQILALVNALPAAAMQPAQLPVGIEGRTIFSDTSDNSALFFDGLNSVPLSIADSLRRLNNMLVTFQQQVGDIGIQVATLQSQLSSDNRNDIATALQNLVNTVASLTGVQNNMALEITALQSGLAKTKTVRLPLSSVPSGNSTVAVNWPSAFIDNSYTVSVSVQDPTGNVLVHGFVYQALGAGVTVSLSNTSGSPVTTSVLHVIGTHD